MKTNQNPTFNGFPEPSKQRCSQKSTVQNHVQIAGHPDLESQIIELPLTFIGRGEVKGFKFEQIKKNSCAYLYAVQNNGPIYFEVFKRKINTRFKQVSYPNAKSFGFTAWTYRDYNKALDKFLELSDNSEHLD